MNEKKKLTDFTYSNCSKTSLQSSGIKMCTPYTLATKNGWQIEVNDKLEPTSRASNPNTQPKKKSLWFDWPTQQFSQILWWSRFTIQAWQIVQWNVRGGTYFRHFGHMFGWFWSLSSESPSPVMSNDVCSSVISGKLSSSLVLCTTWFKIARCLTYINNN